MIFALGIAIGFAAGIALTLSAIAAYASWLESRMDMEDRKDGY
jgi:hypothetical protein